MTSKPTLPRRLPIAGLGDELPEQRGWMRHRSRTSGRSHVRRRTRLRGSKHPARRDQPSAPPWAESGVTRLEFSDLLSRHPQAAVLMRIAGSSIGNRAHWTSCTQHNGITLEQGKRRHADRGPRISKRFATYRSTWPTPRSPKPRRAVAEGLNLKTAATPAPRASAEGLADRSDRRCAGRCRPTALPSGRALATAPQQP